MKYRFVKLSALILFALFVFSCVSPQVVQNDFYLGLMNESNNEKIRLFERALSSSNEYIRRASAEELAILMCEGVDLSPKTMESMRRNAYGWWAEAFAIASPAPGSAPNRERALSFLLGAESNTASFNHARLYVLRECERQGLIFSEKEIAAIEGHHAVFQAPSITVQAARQERYNESLVFFRAFQENGSWPSQMPELFLEYPNLINDLGRAFQYTASGGEGHTLFLRWENNLSNQSDDLRFRLVFFAARIARRMGSSQAAQAIALFERAIVLAPDYNQQDSCIWYILDASVSGRTSVFFERLERHVSKWHNISTYNSVMERYLVMLVTAREWGRIIRTYDLIKDIDGFIPKAGFAWVIARAIEEGYLNAEERRLAARSINASAPEASAFYQVAYNTGESLLMPALYYRMQSAKALGLPFLVLAEETPEDRLPPSPALQFLLGFFAHDAVGFSTPYIRAMERNLSPSELRALAEVLHENEIYTLSMRMISLFLYREGYVRKRRDLELMYPRPYLELVETNAQRFNVEPSILFGLIRTESAFQSAIVSRAGAVGLAQLMPATAEEQAKRIRSAGGPDFLGPENLVDSTNPEVNVYIGSFYYSNWVTHFGSAQLALMSYNGGHFRVRRWRAASDLPVDLLVETVPIYETRDYGRRIPAIGQIYEELYYR